MTILDGKAYAQQIRQDLKNTIIHNKLTPSLCIINIGDDPASKVYVNNKVKACAEVGINCIVKHFDADVTELEVLSFIETMNEDNNINGLMVQLPIPKHLNERNIINSIKPEKDVDGLTDINVGKLLHKDPTALTPCTPLGIISLLKFYNIKLSGKHCVVVGRSNIVGKPLAQLLINEDATVTICHSKTEKLKDITQTADIIIVAIGQPEFLTSDYIKEGAIVVDVGINRVDGKLVGDVDFEDVKAKCSFITPVPGGVGPMTVAALLCNVIHFND